LDAAECLSEALGKTSDAPERLSEALGKTSDAPERLPEVLGKTSDAAERLPATQGLELVSHSLATMATSAKPPYRKLAILKLPQDHAPRLITYAGLRAALSALSRRSSLPRLPPPRQ
jgi:hypothetical protein